MLCQTQNPLTINSLSNGRLSYYFTLHTYLGYHLESIFTCTDSMAKVIKLPKLRQMEDELGYSMQPITSISKTVKRYYTDFKPVPDDDLIRFVTEYQASKTSLPVFEHLGCVIGVASQRAVQDEFVSQFPGL